MVRDAGAAHTKWSRQTAVPSMRMIVPRSSWDRTATAAAATGPTDEDVTTNTAERYDLRCKKFVFFS